MQCRLGGADDRWPKLLVGARIMSNIKY